MGEELLEKHDQIVQKSGLIKIVNKLSFCLTTDTLSCFFSKTIHFLMYIFPYTITEKIINICSLIKTFGGQVNKSSYMTFKGGYLVSLQGHVGVKDIGKVKRYMIEVNKPWFCLCYSGTSSSIQCLVTSDFPPINNNEIYYTREAGYHPLKMSIP